MANPTPLEQLQAQADLPQNKLGKALAALPVVMTVIATLLAGLASGEMTKAQYDRAYGAQLQSKAGDQWAFFQAKRLRGELQRNTIDVLTTSGATLPPGWSTEAPQPAALVVASEVSAALDAARADAPPEAMNPLLQRLGDVSLADALKAAKDRTAAYDTLTAPLIKTSEGTAITRLTFNAARYDVEARLVADIARLYELQVRKTNLSAEHHHLRSQRFFFGMLAAQAAVIVSTFSLAARQRNLLWAFAAVAGLLAVLFAIYVYVYV
jgi:Domain of unknown function (DUF4337)